ncbi:MAG: hypothetical protein QXZ02_04315 [Candidatus Bathyarchaeia archaeon]
MMSEKPSFIIGKCRACGKPIDNAVEGYITDAQGNPFHISCYTQPESRSLRVAGSKPRRIG